LRSSTRLLLGIALSAALLGGAAGCQPTRVTEPVTARHGGADADEQMEFWHTLADQPVTSNDDAFHGLLLYVDQQDPSNTYEERVAAMKGRGMLSANFDEPADQAVSRGTLSVAIAKAINVRGGLLMSLFGATPLGPTPRYATREMVFLDLFPPSSPNQTFSGTEFLGIMGKLEDYQRGVDYVGQPTGTEARKANVEQQEQTENPVPQQPGIPPAPVQPQNPPAGQ
jgi:hypothetical protein